MNPPNVAVYHEPPEYCRSIAAAWEIMQKTRLGIYRLEDKWVVINEIVDGQEHIVQGHFVADAAPMAIALAFLKAS
jgi:hypothetical protein